jgi:hypothetical protein
MELDSDPPRKHVEYPVNMGGGELGPYDVA